MIRKTISTLLILVLAMAVSAQVSIHVDLKNTKTFDSIFVKSPAKLQTKQSLRAAFAPSVTLQDKESLKPGMYEILGDSTQLGEILISTEKNQKFSLTIDKEKVTFANSKENTGYYNYLDGMSLFGKRLDSLNNLFTEAKKSMPQYMLKVFVDSLSASARRINDEMRDYQRRTASANAGTLLGSVIATSTYLEDPPQEIVGNRRLFQKYYLEHFFDNFAW